MQRSEVVRVKAFNSGGWTGVSLGSKVKKVSYQKKKENSKTIKNVKNQISSLYKLICLNLKPSFSVLFIWSTQVDAQKSHLVYKNKNHCISLFCTIWPKITFWDSSFIVFKRLFLQFLRHSESQTSWHIVINTLLSGLFSPSTGGIRC